jgi:4-hydroxy-3-polyprenylbenzoate decarboxylase
MPGVLALQLPAFAPDAQGDDAAIAALCRALEGTQGLEGFPLIVVCDDAEVCARTLDNFLWITFTRSDPARDVHGVGASTRHKHWGCSGSLVIDARRKPGHAWPLEEDPAVSAKVDALAAEGGPLFGLY